MYKNIIFDLGGVVVDFSPREFLVDHFMNETLENALFDITFGSDEWLMMDSGELSREEGNKILMEKGRAIGRSYEVGIILTDWYDMLRTREDTVQLMKRLKRNGYRLFYLSNIAQDVLDIMKARNFWRLFDGGVASCEVMLNKPDMRIYQALLNYYHLNPDECIFVDDNQINAIAATDLGITGMHFRNVRALVRTLISHGIHLEKRNVPKQKRRPSSAPANSAAPKGASAKSATTNSAPTKSAAPKRKP